MNRAVLKQGFRFSLNIKGSGMFWVEIISFVLFVVLTIIWYKSNKRNIMLLASIILLIGLAGPDFISGFSEGYKDATASNSAL